MKLLRPVWAWNQKPRSSVALRGRYLAQSKKISNDQELMQSDPISCPQNKAWHISTAMSPVPTGPRLQMTGA